MIEMHGLRPSLLRSRNGGVQGLGFNSGKATWVLTGGPRITLWSRKEKAMILHDDDGKAEGRCLSWSQKEEYRHWQPVRGEVLGKHHKVLEAQGTGKVSLPTATFVDPYSQEALLGSLPKPLRAA